MVGGKPVEVRRISIPQMHIEHPSTDKLPVLEVKEPF
jgi:hypothetical protein